MIKVVKNQVIGELHCIKYDDGTFEISSDCLFEGEPIGLDREDAEDLREFLKVSVLYGMVGDKTGPVVYQ